MAKNILIVDDAAFMRMMIKDILSKNGYTVAAEAENGKVAVDKYNEAKPDLVLMDITMPVSKPLKQLKQMILMHRLLCVLQWVSRQWLLKQFSPELKISL